MEAAQLQSKVCVQSSHVQEPQKPKNLGWGSMEVYNKKIYIYIYGWGGCCKPRRRMPPLVIKHILKGAVRFSSEEEGHEPNVKTLEVF